MKNVNYVKNGDDLVKLTWYNGEPPKDLRVRQVYGVMFTEDGRIMLKIENKGDKKYYSLAGGTVETYDKDNVATLRREVIEEVNTELGEKTVVIGYQEVENDGKRPKYAQLRMAALIKQINEKRPDPDGGRIYDRLLTTPKKAIELLNWGGIGEILITEAVKIAKKQLGVKEFVDKDEYV